MRPTLANVELIPVTDTVLDELVGIAVSDADADDVTPPLTSGSWSPERIAWLRSYHRDRQPGLGGEQAEATWAVALDRQVVGAVRLKRTEQVGVFETGMWLARSARGRGVSRVAITLLLTRAAAVGGVQVRADTTVHNAAALALLRRCGAHLRINGAAVEARISVQAPLRN